MATRQNNNPFVMPGLGQSADLGQNPLMASMEMMRQAWQGLAGTGALGQSALAASMNPEDLDRRIAELQVVENWLKMNLSMLSSTIQGLEVQRATIATVKAFMGGAAGGMGTVHAGTASKGTASTGAADATGRAAGAFGAAGQSAARPDAGQDQPAASADAGSAQGAGAAPAGGAAGGGAADAMDMSAVQAATQGWWEMLQKQFDTLAAATAATMRPTEPEAQSAAAAAPQGKPARKSAAAKGAARKRTGAAGKAEK